MALGCRHDPVKLGLIITTICFYVVVVLFNNVIGRKLFPKDVGEVSRRYPLDITPLSILFPLIWGTIFLWQAAWLVYSVTLLFRRTSDGALLYRKINILNNVLFIAFIGNCIGMIAWLFFWNYEYLALSFVTLTFLTLCLYVALYVAVRTSYMYNYDLMENGLKLDVWLYRILVLNGLAFFLTWTTIASTLNMATFLAYGGLGIDMTVATTTALVIIFVIMSVYFVMENFLWQRYLLYVFTPWFVILVALVGSLLKNWNSASPTRNNFITLTLLVFASAYTVCKIVMFSLYQTVCKSRVDKKESHKLLQAKEGRSS